VHISKLSGKDFYDAIIRIDKIESFTFRARWPCGSLRAGRYSAV